MSTPFPTAPAGSTPLVPLHRLGLAMGTPTRLWAKLEHFNPGGSAKDRTAGAMIDAALRDGLIIDATSAPAHSRSGDTPPTPMLIESSSGNLGIALARQAQRRGWDFVCVVDPRANAATVATMRDLGATVDVLTAPDPATGDWLTARRARVAELLDRYPQAVNLDQYSNQAAFHAHAEGTMREILEQLGHAPDWLLAAVSTTGTLGGCQRKLREVGAPTRTLAVDATGSVLFGGCRADRVLPGFGAGIVPDLARSVHPDAVTRIPADAAVVGSRILARTEGLLPGASGGAVIAALCAGLRDGSLGGEDIVLILHDSGVNYMDTLYDATWVEEHCGLDATALTARVTEVVGAHGR